MTAARVFELGTRKMFRHQGLSRDLSRLTRPSRLAAMDEERREVLETVCRAMRQKTMQPARGAACRFLLQHLSQG
jgi:hypothetical protein